MSYEAVTPSPRQLQSPWKALEKPSQNQKPVGAGVATVGSLGAGRGAMVGCHTESSRGSQPILCLCMN